jgi:hypothetical protein
VILTGLTLVVLRVRTAAERVVPEGRRAVMSPVIRGS